MIEYLGDLWAFWGQPGHRIGISTNGFVKRNGQAVMGRGCAMEATLRFPGIATRLGDHIRTRGNVPGYIQAETDRDGKGFPRHLRLLILPVKHNWWEQASLELIDESIAFLRTESQNQPDVTFHVPRLGCGNGRLSWANEVRPLMEVLPNNVVVHS